MTTLVALVHNEIVYMACDSRVSFGRIATLAHSKIKRNGDFLIAGSGHLRVVQIAQHLLSVRARFEHESDLDYMVSAFATQLRDELQGSVDQHEWASFLVGYNGKLFFVNSDYAVVQMTETFTALGSGESFALGALAANSHLPPKERLQQALEVACKFDPHSAKPFFFEPESILN